MNDRWLVSSFSASSLIHLGLVPVAALVMHAKPIIPVAVPIELVDVPRVEQPKKVEVAPSPPAPKTKVNKITAPELLSKPVLETSPPATSRQYHGRSEREAVGTTAAPRFLAEQRQCRKSGLE